MSDGPSLGGRVRIYWPSEKRWFRGEVKLRRMKRGCAEHRVDYDDGDSRWHNLESEAWLHLAQPRQTITPSPQQYQKRRRRRRQEDEHEPVLFVVERIMEARTSDGGAREFLVRWAGYSAEHDS